MSDRKQYVWKLDIWYPTYPVVEGHDPIWCCKYDPSVLLPVPWKWPRKRRAYVSLDTAARHAAWLTKHGCKVEIVRSEPVVWPS